MQCFNLTGYFVKVLRLSQQVSSLERGASGPGCDHSRRHLRCFRWTKIMMLGSSLNSVKLFSHCRGFKALYLCCIWRCLWLLMNSNYIQIFRSLFQIIISRAKSTLPVTSCAKLGHLWSCNNGPMRRHKRSTNKRWCRDTGDVQAIMIRAHCHKGTRSERSIKFAFI